MQKLHRIRIIVAADAACLLQYEDSKTNSQLLFVCHSMGESGPQVSCSHWNTWTSLQGGDLSASHPHRHHESTQCQDKSKHTVASVSLTCISGYTLSERCSAEIERTCRYVGGLWLAAHVCGISQAHQPAFPMSDYSAPLATCVIWRKLSNN